MSSNVKKGPFKNGRRLATQTPNQSGGERPELNEEGNVSVIPLIDELAGDSEADQKIRYLIMRAAELNSTVFITGELGAGITTVARSIHALSARAGGPFIEVWCETADAQEILDADIF